METEPALRALRYVRELLQADLDGGPEPAPPAGLERPVGVFVSLHKAGHLRGCMGRLEADLPLGQALRRMARCAAFEDPRFPALKAGELAQCEVEISLLGPVEPVSGPGELRLGEHGVTLDCAGRRAVFLPQVAPEQGWTLEETLSHLARKAGLPPDAWRRDDCRLGAFTAQVLREG